MTIHLVLVGEREWILHDKCNLWEFERKKSLIFSEFLKVVLSSWNAMLNSLEHALLTAHKIYKLRI